MSLSLGDLRAAELQYSGSMHRKPADDSFSAPQPRSKRTEAILTVLSVIMWCVSKTYSTSEAGPAVHEVLGPSSV